MAKGEGRNVSDVIGVGFELDTSNLRKGVREASNLIKGIKADTSSANAGMADWKKTTEGLTNKLSELSKVEKIQQQVVDALTDQYKDLAEEFGENSERAIRAYRSLAKWETGLKRTRLESESYAKQLKAVSDEYAKLEKHSKLLERGLSITRGVMINLVTDGIHRITSGMKDSIQSAIEYEAAFKDVQKTVNGTLAELVSLDTNIRNMAVTSLPKTASELASIAAIGGQLGIPVAELSKFTKIMTQLGDSTNVTAEQAALLISKIGAQTGLDPKQFDRFASTLVALGNNFATTEDKILDMTNRIASSGAIVGASEQQLLALATALSATGAEAEAGGTALTRLFKRFQIAVETQNKDLPKLAKIAGMATEEFRKLFGQDAVGALLAFTHGLAEMDAQGTSVAQNLADLGITEVRLTETIQKLVLNEEGVERALKLANEAWDENTALSKEAETRYESLASKIQFAKNAVKEFGISVVENLGVGSVMEGALSVFDSFLRKINETIDPIQKVERLLSEIGQYGSDTEIGKNISLYDAVEAYDTAEGEKSKIRKELNERRANLEALQTVLEDYRLDTSVAPGVLDSINEEKKLVDELEAKYGLLLSRQDDIAHVLATEVELTDGQLDMLGDLNPLLREAYDIHTKTAMVIKEEGEEAEEAVAKFSADAIVEKYKSQQTKAKESIEALRKELKEYKKAMSEATSTDDIDEYERAIKAVTEELERQEEQYEKMYGIKQKEQEERFSADQIILKYGSEMEKSLVRQKQLQAEIDKLLKEQNEHRKQGLNDADEYERAIGLIRTQLFKAKDVPIVQADSGLFKDKNQEELDPKKILSRYGTEYEKTEIKIAELKDLEKKYRKRADAKINDWETYEKAADALKKTYVDLENTLNKDEWWKTPMDALDRYQKKWGETVDFIGSQIKDLIDTRLAYQEESAQKELDDFRKNKNEEENELKDKLARGEITYAEYYKKQYDMKNKNDARELELTKKLEEKKKAIWVANQANQVAQATINGAVAATKALADLGPIAGPLAATTIAALTLGQIATILNQQYQVPALAKGGVVDRPTYALVGEAGREAVMPLENNTGWIDELAGKLVIRMEGGTTVSDSHNKDYQITQNIYAKPATRRELYLATRRAMEA